MAVDPSAVWEFVQEARESGTSLYQVLKVRKRDSHAGCAGTAGDNWIIKHKTCMMNYVGRRWLERGIL